MTSINFFLPDSTKVHVVISGGLRSPRVESKVSQERANAQVSLFALQRLHGRLLVLRLNLKHFASVSVYISVFPKLLTSK